VAPLFGPPPGKAGTRPHGTECSMWNAGWTENRESEAFEMAHIAVVWRARDRDGVNSKNGTELENEVVVLAEGTIRSLPSNPKGRQFHMFQNTSHKEVCCHLPLGCHSINS